MMWNGRYKTKLDGSAVGWDNSDQSLSESSLQMKCSHLRANVSLRHSHKVNWTFKAEI